MLKVVKKRLKQSMYFLVYPYIYRRTESTRFL